MIFDVSGMFRELGEAIRDGYRFFVPGRDPDASRQLRLLRRYNLQRNVAILSTPIVAASLFVAGLHLDSQDQSATVSTVVEGVPLDYVVDLENALEDQRAQNYEMTQAEKNHIRNMELLRQQQLTARQATLACVTAKMMDKKPSTGKSMMDEVIDDAADAKLTPAGKDRERRKAHADAEHKELMDSMEDCVK